MRHHLHYQLAAGIRRGGALDVDGAPRHESLDGWAGTILGAAYYLRTEAYEDIQYTGNIRELRQDLASIEAYVKGIDRAVVTTLEIIIEATR